MPRDIVPNLWFDGNAEEAVAFYVSVFPGARVLSEARYPGTPGSVMRIEFELLGRRFTAINGGPQFPFTEAVSFAITCDDQDEVDQCWALLAEGGEEGQCGWLKDRFGLSWQVIPEGMGALLGDPDRERAGRAMQAMRKLDIAALRAAADAEPAAR